MDVLAIRFAGLTSDNGNKERGTQQNFMELHFGATNQARLRYKVEAFEWVGDDV